MQNGYVREYSKDKFYGRHGGFGESWAEFHRLPGLDTRFITSLRTLDAIRARLRITLNHLTVGIAPENP